MQAPVCLLSTDLVESTLLNQQIGDAAMAKLWLQHDRRARQLLRVHRGREIGRSDGFIALFEVAIDALAFARAYHRAVADLQPPMRARIGLHAGPVTLRTNTPDDLAHGAALVEVDGLAVAVTARVMALGQAGQTLASSEFVHVLEGHGVPLCSHGFWRLKGVAEPQELFEAADANAPVRPLPDTPKAYRVVRAAECWVTLNQLPNNLPAERDAFVGQAATLRALHARLDDGARLVSVVGLGGVGKTRLALQYARAWMGAYAGGSWFCDLSAARGLDGIVHAVAQALGVAVGAGDAAQTVGRALAARDDCLVLLDNFEQVVRHAQPTLGLWLDMAPAARFVVTTREALGLPGEQLLAVEPLAASDAVQLFRLRAAAAAGMGPPAVAEDEPLLRPLVERLDRLPLAIELAAARSRLMPARQMLERLDERFDLLVARGGRCDRQSTMRAALDWSWELLSDAERMALAQLSVFESGFEIDDAEAVVDAGGGVWIPDLLQALLEKSLLRRLHEGRLGLLRTVQDYAGDRLDEAATAGAAVGLCRAAAEARHARRFAALTEAQATRQRGVELDNLVAACRRACAAGLTEAAPLLGHAWAVLRQTGPFQAGVDLATLVAAGLSVHDAGHATVQRVLGAACSLLGRGAEARRHLKHAAQTARRHGAAATLVDSLALLAGMEVSAGGWDAAQQLLDDADAVPAAPDDTGARITVLSVRAKSCVLRAQWNEARGWYTQALVLAEGAGDRRWQGGLWGNLGMVANAQGRRDDARRHWQTSLRFACDIGDRQWAGNTRCNLGLLLHELGQADAAEAELEAALVIARELGHRRLEATVLCNLGLVAEARQAWPVAVQSLEAAAALAALIGDAGLEASARGYLGLALAGAGHHARAEAEVGRAANLSAPHDAESRALAQLQAALVAAAAGNRDAAAARLRAAHGLRPLDDCLDGTELAPLLARVRAAQVFAHPGAS